MVFSTAHRREYTTGTQNCKTFLSGFLIRKSKRQLEVSPAFVLELLYMYM